MTAAPNAPQLRVRVWALRDDPQRDEQALAAGFGAGMPPLLIAMVHQHGQTQGRGALLLHRRGQRIRDIRGQALPCISSTPALAAAHGSGWPTDAVAAAVQRLENANSTAISCIWNCDFLYV
ncbi:MAG: hypothetical protein MI924_35725 [Chloroflexales bacterium]|nr:hypothetical protein [Chloroflexales bacterium]